MVTKLYVVYDEKALVYKYPQFQRSAGEAIRSFTLAVQDQNTEIGKFPEDFTLYEVGAFDDQNAQFESLPNPVNLGKGLQYVRTLDSSNN